VLAVDVVDVVIAGAGVSRRDEVRSGLAEVLTVGVSRRCRSEGAIPLERSRGARGVAAGAGTSGASVRSETKLLRRIGV
jgi:hypothetical protein